MPFEHDIGDSSQKFKTNREVLTSRAQAKAVECPECGAPPQEPCMGLRKPRVSCHLERHHKAREVMA